MKQNPAGFSIVEIMIGVGIVATGFAAMFSLMEAQVRNQKYITQKYETQELASQLKARLPLGNFCRCNFPGTHDFSTPLLERLVQRIFTPRDPTGTNCTDADELVPVSGEIPSSSGLKVRSMKLKNLIPLPVPNSANMDLEVVFEHEAKQTPLRPILIPGIPVTT